MPFQPIVPPTRRFGFVYTLAEIVRRVAAESGARDVARGAFSADPPVLFDDVPTPPVPAAHAPPRSEGDLTAAPAGYRARITREPRLPLAIPRTRWGRLAWHWLTLRLPWAWYRRRLCTWKFYGSGPHDDVPPHWYRRRGPRWLAAFPTAPWWRVLWHLLTLRLVWAWARRRIFCWFTYHELTDMGGGNVTRRHLRARVAIWQRRWARERQLAGRETLP